jgi:hypothetical protein
MSNHYISEISLQRIKNKRAERESGITTSKSSKMRPKSSYEKGYGVIYIIGSGDGSTPYKIGFTSRKDTSKRLDEIQAGSWIKLELLYESPVLNNITQIEKLIHFHYKGRRVRNEWFALTKKELARLKNQLKNGYFTDEKITTTYSKTICEVMTRMMQERENVQFYEKLLSR